MFFFTQEIKICTFLAPRPSDDVVSKCALKINTSTKLIPAITDYMDLFMRINRYGRRGCEAKGFLCKRKHVIRTETNRSPLYKKALGLTINTKNY